MKSHRVRCVATFFKFLLSECISDPQIRLLLTNLSNLQVKALTEIIHNLFYSKIRLNEITKSKLKSRRRILKKIGNDRLSLGARKRLIKKHWYLIWIIISNIKNILKRVW
jgi:hypothetical protein